ncbi:hypothetical protein J7E91_20675 [Streptomyces sp. ISL-99]|uniref:hypothetical protein n=1 Tax=Streptomyces sp. ISL-99 TaxID=2819193 RepID=UPI001BEAE0C5|nr:hypothetical protein [Streptomyces sp. ISL-99]MBT2527772.1 hypothetical protein [Streptomyces sp. ISL-99]
MPTAIAVTSADLVLPPTDQQTPTAALLQAPDAQPLEAALVDMNVMLERYGYVVAVYPASIAAAHERRLHTIRSMLETDRLALLKLDLPPLGIAVLVRQLRQLSICDFSAGVVASAARLLSHYIYAGALLNSVTKLDRVPVSLKSHAKSWMPGSQFGVLANPEPQLIKISSSGTGAASGAGVGAGAGVAAGSGAGAGLSGPGFATQLLVGKGTLVSDWVTATLAPAWQVSGVQETGLPADSPRWWGTAKMIEFAAFLPDISVLYQLVASVRREKCHWCGIELIGDRCGFCSAPLTSPENQSRAVGVLNQGSP